MLPSAVVSAVIKIEGMQSAVRQLKDFSTVAKETGSQTVYLTNATEKVKPAADKASQGVSNLGRTSKTAHTSIKEMVTGLLAAGGAFAAFEGAKNAIDTTIELGNYTQRLSAATRMDIKTSSEWIEVMKVKGQAATATGRQFISLSRNVQEAEKGTKAASQTFKELGISQDTLRKTDPSDLIKLIADRFAALGPSSQRAAIAQKLFGVGTQALIPVLASGSKGVDELLASAQRYGAFLPNNKEQIDKAVAAQENLNLAMDGLKITFTRAVLPTLLSGANHLMKFIAQMRNGRGEGGKFAKEVSKDFHTVKDVIKTVVNAVGGVKPALEIAAGAFLATRIVSMARAFGGAITGGVNSLKSLPGHLRSVASLLGFGKTARGVAGAVESVAPIPEMTVTTMFVKTMITPGSGGGLLNTIEKDVKDVTEGKTALTLLDRIKAFFRGGGEASAAGRYAALATKSPITAAGVLTIPLAAFTSMKGVQGTSPLNRLNAALHGIDLTNVAHVVGLPSLSDLLLPSVQQPQSNAVGLKSYTQRTTAGALGGPAVHASVTQITKDYLAYNDALSKLEQKQAGINQTANTLARLARQANRIGDFRYSIADKLGSELIKTQNVASGGVKGIIGKLKALPPQARAQAALAMIEMSRTLEREGAVPRGTTARLSKEIAAPLRVIGIHAKTSAGLVRQLTSAINRLPKSKNIDFNINVGVDFTKLAARLFGGVFGPLSRLPEFATPGHIPLLDTHGHILSSRFPRGAPSLTPSVPHSVQRVLDTVGSGVGKTISETERKLKQVESAQGALTTQRLALEGRRNALENQLMNTRSNGLKNEIKHELQINAARLRGVSHEASILASRKSGLSAQLSSEKSAASAHTKSLAAQAKAQKSAAEAAKKAREAEQKHIAWIVAVFGHLPSQSGLQQIRMQEIQNRLTTATSAGNIGGQRSALNAEKKLDREWLAMDKKKLQSLNKKLKQRGLPKSERRGLIQDKLALLQEIGNIESDLGTVATSLQSLDSGGDTSGTSGFDLAPTGSAVTMPTAFDVRSQIPGGGVHHHHHHHGNITVNVHKGGDEKKVYDALDRYTGGPIHARVRRAGLRGT